MASMPRLLAVARRPLAASLYRVVFSVAGRLPPSATATASSPPVRDLAHRCALPPAHGWDTRVSVRAFSSSTSSGGGGGPGESGAGESGAVQGQTEEQVRPETKRRSRAKTSCPTSPPARSSEEGKRCTCTYLQAEDPGLRNLGGMSTSAPADGIVKDTVAAVGTDAFDSSGGVYTGDSSAIGKGTVTTVDADASHNGVNPGAASAIDKVMAPSGNADASHNGVNPGAGRGSAMNKVMVQPSGNADASHGVVNAGAVSAMSKVTVPAFSDSSVNTGGAMACISKDDVPDGGVNMDIVKALVAGVVDKGAAFDTGTNVASAMAKEAGHGVEGTPKRRARVTRVKTATAVPQKPAAAGVGKDVTPVKRGVRKADVEKNVAPGKRSRQDRLADAVNDTGKVSEPGVSKDKGAPAGTASSAGTSATSKKATVRVKAAAAAPEKPADGADLKNEKAPRKGRSGSATGVKNEKAPGNGADAKQSTVPGNGAGAKQNTAPGNGASVNQNAAPGNGAGEKKKKTQYIRAVENRIERGFFRTRAHLERRLSWLQSSIESMLQRHMKKSIEENQIAIEKLNSKQTSRLFFSLFAQLLGILGVCLYVTYKYAWPYVEKKVYELPYDDRAKALALQAFDSAFKYAVAKITFQETRDELRKKLPPWLGGREDEKKGEEEEKKEEEVTHPWWWLLWPPNCWKNKKEKEKKRKEDEEKKKKKKEEEKKRKEEEEEKKRKGEKKEYSSWLWCLWPGYWWWLLKNSWSRKDGQKEEVQEK